MLRGTQFMVL